MTPTMDDYCELFALLQREKGLKSWQALLQEQIQTALASKHWAAMPSLPELLNPLYASIQSTPSPFTPREEEEGPVEKRQQRARDAFHQAAVTVGQSGDLNSDQRQMLHNALCALKPWRKGPFNLFGIDIDTEWRSDWKWDRVAAHIECKNKRILDVGCGNGYYLWRMLGAGAKLALGVDPSVRYLLQWQVVRHCLNISQQLYGERPYSHPAYVLPIGAEQLPDNLSAFDLTFSMGVFYHRKSPIEHIMQMRNTLRPGGQLVLETLVIDGDEETVLIPKERYAQMPNVWFIPSASALTHWLKRCKFKRAECVDITPTTVGEQRTTEWIDTHSLPNFLHPDDPTRTIEGYPAPQRALFIAERHC